MRRLIPAALARFATFAPALVGCLLLLPGVSAGAQDQPELAAAVSAAESALRSGETQLAESLYRGLLLDAWMQVGAGRAVDGDLVGARDAFERATRQALELRRPTLALASVELRLGEVDSAVARLRRLQGRRSDDTEVRRLMARALSAAGKEEEALQELQEAHVAAPDDPELTFYLATGHLKLEQVDTAAALFERVAAARPIPETHVLIGRTWRDVQQFERARAALRRALEMDPGVRKARFYLGTVSLLDEGRGALEDAIVHFRSELELAPDDPLAHLFLGLSLVEVRRFEEALPHLDVAAAHDGTRFDALHFRGRALLALDRPEEAVSSLQRALEIGSEDASAAGNQMGSLHYQLAQALRKTGRMEEARPHFDAAEAVLEDFTDESRERLRRYLDDAPREVGGTMTSVAVPTLGLEALADAERAAYLRGVRDVIARANLNLGILQSRGGRPGRAAEHFRVAAETAADESLLRQASYSRGVALFQAGRHDEALEPLENAWAERSSDDPTLLRMLAMTRLEAGRWQGAAELLSRDPQLSTDPSAADPSLQFAYGTALVRSGRADEALAVFDFLAQTERPDLAVLFGQAYAQEGDWAEAETSLRRALEMDPTVAGAHSTLGEIFLRQGELDRAETELRSELSLHPGDPHSLFLLATVLDLTDQLDAAEETIRALLDQTPDDADARYLLGKILFGQQDYEASAAQLEAAVRLAPRDSNVRYQLAQTYQRLGRRELARETFDVYRQLKAESRAQVGADADPQADLDDEGGGS